MHTGRYADAETPTAVAEELKRVADEEIRVFRAWRTSFVGPRRDAWGHFEEASRQAQERARRALMHLHFAWAALATLLTDEEQATWLERCAWRHSQRLGLDLTEKRSSSSLNSARSACLPTASSPMSVRPNKLADPWKRACCW